MLSAPNVALVMLSVAASDSQRAVFDVIVSAPSVSVMLPIKLAAIVDVQLSAPPPNDDVARDGARINIDVSAKAPSSTSPTIERGRAASDRPPRRHR